MVQDWRPQEVAETLGCDWSPAGIVLEGRGPGSQICSHSQLPFHSMGLGGHLQNDSVVVRWIQISSLRPPLQRCNLSCSDQLTEVSFTCLESTKSAGFLSIRNYSPWMGGREELIWETFQKQGLHILHPVSGLLRWKLGQASRCQGLPGSFPLRSFVGGGGSQFEEFT